MKAWDQLLANSSLSGGTAWELLTNPAAGTGFGVVVSDGVVVSYSDEAIVVEVETMQIEVELAPVEVEAVIEDSPFVVELSSTPIEVEVSP